MQIKTFFSHEEKHEKVFGSFKHKNVFPKWLIMNYEWLIIHYFTVKDWTITKKALSQTL